MFTVENLKEFLKQASLGIADAKDMLTQLDAQAGDGDLGVNMEQGFKAVAEAVETEQPESLQETFFVSAVAINSAAPSTLYRNSPFYRFKKLYGYYEGFDSKESAD